MAKSLNFHKNVIRRPGDKEVVGKMVKWPASINSVAEAYQEALKESGSDGLRHNAAEHTEKRAVR